MKKIITAVIALPLIAFACINTFVPGWIFDGVLHATRAAAQMQAKVIQVGDYQYGYLDNGQSQHPSMLLIHGFAAESDNWTRMVTALEGQYRIVAIDLLGHGRSDKPMDANYQISAQVERVKAFVDAIGLSAFHLVGNSMGGHISGMFAARHPAYVKSLSFINSGGIRSPIVADAWQAVAAGEPNPLVLRSADDAERFFNYVMTEEPFMTDSIKRYFAERSMGRQTLNDYIFNFLRDDNFEDLALELPKIRAPVQILWGENDRILHVSSIEVMAPLLNKPRIVLMKNTGHGPMLERPKATAKALDDFIQSL